jgi:TPP-dependent pyruvate/acetoin dehydrogenase alpha subunit
MEAVVESEVEQALTYAQESQYPDPDQVLTHVYAQAGGAP